ncbi:DUF547 domain-containing protein [Vampirovibrio sp.]|uniref:DUF547 domain-containing protein n=1 Tax=Vampirovibrio sp. TaxID=2717857 RepID=UPI0035930124
MRAFSFAWKLTSLLTLCVIGAYAQAGRVIDDSMVTRPFRHHVWQAVLTDFVNCKAEVDFAKLRAHPKRLNDYLGQLAACSPENDPTAFPKASDKTAYWINAHNALALRIILDHYPIATTTHITDLETNIHYQLGGKAYSLKKIRQKLGLYAKQDPQLLFTLTDYTVGSPRIQREAFEGSSLTRLEKQAVSEGISNPEVIRIEKAGACTGLQLSPFFKGYERGLFSRPVASVEDRDHIPEAGFVPVALTSEGWVDHLRPFLPPAAYARLGNGCHNAVVFMVRDKNLRQVRF